VQLLEPTKEDDVAPVFIPRLADAVPHLNVDSGAALALRGAILRRDDELLLRLFAATRASHLMSWSGLRGAAASGVQGNYRQVNL